MFQERDIPATAFLSVHFKILKVCESFKNKVRSMITIADNDNSDNEKYDLRFNQLYLNYVWLQVMTKLQCISGSQFESIRSSNRYSVIVLGIYK